MKLHEFKDYQRKLWEMDKKMYETDSIKPEPTNDKKLKPTNSKPVK
jgi:hypothetical protein